MEISSWLKTFVYIYLTKGIIDLLLIVVGLILIYYFIRKGRL